MLEEKSIDQMDSYFPFVAAYVDRAIREEQRRLMTDGNTNDLEHSYLFKRKIMEHVPALQSLNATKYSFQAV